MPSKLFRYAAFVWTLAVAGVASAQVPPAKVSAPPPSGPTKVRGLIVVGGAYRVLENSFTTERITKLINAETASHSTRYDVEPGMTVDVSGGVALWRNLGVKLGVSTYTASTPGAFQAEVPHPFFFNQPRAIANQTSGIDRRETAIDLHAAGIFAANSRMIVMVAAGPTLFNLKQDLVTDFTYSDSYPYDSATLGSLTTRTGDTSKIGLGAGVTVGVFLNKFLGFAVGGQFSTAEVALDAAESATAAVKLGGARGVVSLAARF